MKVPRDECSGRILMGDNNDGGAVILRPIRFHCVEVYEFQLDTLVYIKYNGHESAICRNPHDSSV